MRNTGWIAVGIILLIGVLVYNNSSTVRQWAQIGFFKNDTLVGIGPSINLIEGPNVTITAAYDGPNNQVDYTLTSALSATPTPMTTGASAAALYQGTGASTAAWGTPVPNCNGTTEKLTFNSATRVWGCGTDETGAPGSGDVSDVGDCTTGACFTAAGTGTTLTFHGGTSGTGILAVPTAISGGTTWTLPDGGGNVCVVGSVCSPTPTIYPTPTPSSSAFVFVQPGNISTGTSVGGGRVYAPWTTTITSVYCSLTTAPTTDAVTLDINYDGTTIFTTQGNRPSIAATAFYDDAGAPEVTAVVAGHYLTMDIDAVDTGNTAADLVCVVVVKP